MDGPVRAAWIQFTSRLRDTAKVDEMNRLSHEVARESLSLADVWSANVAVPPLAEQHRGIAEVDSRLAIVREVEVDVDANLKRAQALC